MPKTYYVIMEVGLTTDLGVHAELHPIAVTEDEDIAMDYQSKGYLVKDVVDASDL